jgi:hypothetical protein
MTVLTFYRWGIKVLHLEETEFQTFQLLEISIVNGRRYSTMAKNLTIMVEKEKGLVLMNTTMTQSLSQPQKDS